MATAPAKTAQRPAPGKTAARPATAAAKPASRPAPPPAARPAPPAQPQRQANVPAKRQTTAVVATDVPEHIRTQGSRGSENVDMQDLVIPRVELVQALSKCLEAGDAGFIEGARPGMFYNSVTRHLYGENVIVCPVFFRKQWLAWKDRKLAEGGFGGAFDSMQDCLARINEEQDAQLWEAVETAQQIVLVVDLDTYDTHEAIVSMARTKMKVSRQWNSLIRLNGFDRFSRLYELFGTDEKNSQNKSYKNIGVRLHDWAPVDVYKRGEELYTSIASGERKVKMDDNFDDGSVIDGDASAPEGAAPAEY